MPVSGRQTKVWTLWPYAWALPANPQVTEVGSNHVACLPWAAASLIAANLSPFATAANAGQGSWKKYDDKRAYSRNYDSRHYDGPRNRFAYNRGRDHRHSHRHGSGNDIAKGFAMGRV